MQELIKLIDSRISKNLSNDMSLKSAPCTVIDVLENDTIKVNLISNGAEYTVGNYSGSQVQIGETVQLFYKGIINQNNAYIGAALYKENENSGDDIVDDSSMKNIIMNTKTGDLGNTKFSLADVYLSAKQSTDITIFFNTNILGQEDNNIVFSVFVDGVEQPYKPIVSTTNQLYSAVSFSTPVSLDDGIHSVEIRSSGIGIVENVCAYVAGQYIEGASFTIYGYHVNPNESDSYAAVSYIADAVGMTPAKMGTNNFDYGSWENAFFMPKPCILRYDGTVAYYLDPNDYTKKIDGTPSDIANPDFEGNAMMEWGQIWYKFAGGDEDGEGYFYVSNRQVDESYHCWCNYNSKDEITPHFYTAIYNSTLHDGKFRSLSGVALTQKNGVGYTNGYQEITYCKANNTTEDVEWYTDVYADRILINALLVLTGKSLNTQVTFGRGLNVADKSVKDAHTTGSLNSKGLFYGFTSTDNLAVKVFGMENWWGFVGHRTAGCVTVEHECKVKLTYGTADGSTVNGYKFNGNGYISIGNVSSTNGYIKKFKYNEYGYMPYEVGGSYTTYYADWLYSNVGTGYLSVGGDHISNGDSVGAFNFDTELSYSNSAGWRSTTLSCKPIA